jgi:transcriptional regulator with XRE-family HTH domain
MSFNITIKQLRENADASQQGVADAIGIARATYAGLENGRREPNLAEIRGIAEFYQISPSDLIDGNVGEVNMPAATYVFTDDTHVDIIPRDVPALKAEKLREVLLYLLEKVGAKPNVGETVMYKLLYFIDFDYYEKYGESVTGLTYVRNHYGPTPQLLEFTSIIDSMKLADELEVIETPYFSHKQKKYLPTVKPSLDKLSAKELDHINDEILRLADKSATELSELSHLDIPWLASKDKEVIDYQLAMYRTNATSVREYEDEL